MEINCGQIFCFSFIATVAFAILFQAPRKSLPISGCIGAAGWLLFTWLLKVCECNSFIANLAATLLVALASELAARFFKHPTTIFVIPGVIPLVPGLGMYQGMARIIAKNYDSGISTLLTAAGDATAIALGIMFVTSIFRVLKTGQKQQQVKK